MRTFYLSRSLWLASPLEEVFSFFSDAANLQTLTPTWVQFKILTPPPIIMKVGCRIDYRIKLKGFPLKWQSEITAWEPKDRFVDEQLSGPYRRWVHEHLFREEKGGTRVEDNVEYSVFGGALVNRLFVKPDLERIFNYRGEAMRKIFGGN